MVYHKISANCKLAAIRLYDSRLLSLDFILSYCGFSRRTWFRVIKLWQETGHVIQHRVPQHGHLRILDTEDIQYLLHLIQFNPDYFLDGLLKLLAQNQFISVHYTTVFHELKQAGMSHKKLKWIAIE